MSARVAEPEMEALLLRIVPGLSKEWQGATPDEIARIEQLAGRALPPFYRWFLSRMGKSMGRLAYPTLDFSASRVLACYEEKMVAPESRLYERADAAMVCNSPPREDFEGSQVFTLGGADAGALRRILGEIATEPSLEVEVDEWKPEARVTG